MDAGGTSVNNLPKFQEQLRLARTNPRAERIVRIMLEEVAKDCPLAVLLRLGETLVECRKEEIIREGN